MTAPDSLPRLDFTHHLRSGQSALAGFAELMQVEGEVSRSEAIRRAIEDYLKRRRIEKFMDLAGSGLVDMDRRQAETAEVQKATRCGRKP